MINLPQQNASIYEKVDWCIYQITELDKRLDKLAKSVPIKPWYTSFGIWLAIILVLLALLIIYVFYLSTLGYTTPYLPNWMK